MYGFEPKRALPTERPKPARRIDYRAAGNGSQHKAANAVAVFLRERHVVKLGHLAIAGDHVGLTTQDRLDQHRDLVGHVLAVCVDVDDDVGAMLDSRLKRRSEGNRQTEVAPQSDYVIRASLVSDP